MSQRINLVVDGKATVVEADPAMPLLYALRSELAYTSPKFGCGRAQCGACTVHVDGAPTRSCVMPLSAVAGKRITTLAGLGTPERPHPLQKAFVEEQVPQCGYCQGGQILAAVALLRKHPQPTDRQIDEAMTNLCRCGTYARVRAAIHAVARKRT